MARVLATSPPLELSRGLGENDPARRRATIDEIITEDCVLVAASGRVRGRGSGRHGGLIMGRLPAAWPSPEA
jgi:hypothetical protein